MSAWWAEHRAPFALSLSKGPKPASASRETRLALVASRPAQAGPEPRHSLPSGDRAAYSAREGHTWAERRAPFALSLSKGPKPAHIPSGDRAAYSAREGHTFA